MCRGMTIHCTVVGRITSQAFGSQDQSTCPTPATKLPRAARLLSDSSRRRRGRRLRAALTSALPTKKMNSRSNPPSQLSAGAEVSTTRKSRHGRPDLEYGLGNGLLIYADEVHGLGIHPKCPVEGHGGRQVECRACNIYPRLAARPRPQEMPNTYPAC